MSDNPESIYAKLKNGQAVALFRRSINGPRYDAITGAFADGNRLVSRIVAI